MDVHLELPVALEGRWELQDSQGNVIASSSEISGAQLFIQPNFYVGTQTQTLMRATVKGKSGRTKKQTIKVGGNAGVIKAEQAGALPKQVIPGFDKVPVKAKREGKSG